MPDKELPAAEGRFDPYIKISELQKFIEDMTRNAHTQANEIRFLREVVLNLSKKDS